MSSSSSHTFQQAPSYWERKGLMALLLWPLSKLFGFISHIRKSLYAFGLLRSHSLGVPVIIVGNLRVGGTGKTPTVLAIAKTLREQGFHPCKNCPYKLGTAQFKIVNSSRPNNKLIARHNRGLTNL